MSEWAVGEFALRILDHAACFGETAPPELGVPDEGAAVPAGTGNQQLVVLECLEMLATVAGYQNLADALDAAVRSQHQTGD